MVRLTKSQIPIIKILTFYRKSYCGKQEALISKLWLQGIYYKLLLTLIYICHK